MVFVRPFMLHRKYAMARQPGIAKEFYKPDNHAGWVRACCCLAVFGGLSWQLVEAVIAQCTTGLRDILSRILSRLLAAGFP